MANIVLGMPTMGTVDAKTFESLFKIWRDDNKVFPLMTEYSLVYMARDNIAKRMLENPDAEYLWFVDSDIVVPQFALRSLIKADKDIVSAVYPYKSDQEGVVGFGLDLKKLEEPGECLQQIGRCGMGCCLIKRKVLEDVFNTYKSAFAPMGELGEDFSFCERAKVLGYEIYMDWSIKCSHVGKKVFEV